MHFRSYILVVIGLSVLLTGCRTDEVVYPSLTEQVDVVAQEGGLYVLNEGNMGANKAQIDYMDLSSGVYTRNMYGARNPNAMKELGDVGNDLQVYGGRMWAVINCSHKVEVMDLECRRIGQVDLPNCRRVVFADGMAYVSAYVGSVASPELLGAVYEVDTASLQVRREVEVGHQPDGMCVVGTTLYVCNSGGYLKDRYDSTLSCIDLGSMTVKETVVVGVNPEHAVADGAGNVWVSCRGDRAERGAQLVEVADGKVVRRLAMNVSQMSRVGDVLYCLDAEKRCVQAVSTTTGSISALPINIDEMEHPSGLLVTDRCVYVSDAKNYVSSGTLHCYRLTGERLWSTTTGDIPAHLCAVGIQVKSSPTDSSALAKSPYIARVYDYHPALGQFVNLLPKYEEGDTEEQMRAKCEEALKDNARGTVTLGGWGGYITFGFDGAVANHSGRDFQILGNAFYLSGDSTVGSSEPGIVLVSRDVNGNGLPDDRWYELAGSEYASERTNHAYSKTYTREGDTVRNPYHTQAYYPQWYGESVTFEGALLESQKQEVGGQAYQKVLDYGYADNKPNTDTEGSAFDISWAVDERGEKVELGSIDFVRVYTAVDETNGVTGELSTEIMGAVILEGK